MVVKHSYSGFLVNSNIACKKSVWRIPKKRPQMERLSYACRRFLRYLITDQLYIRNQFRHFDRILKVLQALAQHRALQVEHQQDSMVTEDMIEGNKDLMREPLWIFLTDRLPGLSRRIRLTMNINNVAKRLVPL